MNNVAALREEDRKTEKEKYKYLFPGVILATLGYNPAHNTALINFTLSEKDISQPQHLNTSISINVISTKIDIRINISISIRLT